MKGLFLKRQLRQSGASLPDSKALSDIAHKVAATTPGLSSEAKTRIAQDIGFKQQRNLPKLRIGLIGATAAFAVLLVVAQSALPGSVLYALKRGSEEVRVVLQPGFNEDDLRQRRQDEQQRVRENQERKKSRIDATDDSGRDSGSDDSLQKSSDDGQKIEEIKVDGSGHGSGSSTFSSDINGSGSSGSSSRSSDSD